MRLNQFLSTILLLVCATRPLNAADTPAKEKTPEERKREARAESLKAMKSGVEKALAKHPETPADLKNALLSPSLHAKWLDSVQTSASAAFDKLAGAGGANLPIDDATKAALKADLESQSMLQLSESAAEGLIARALKDRAEAQNGGKQPGANDSPFKGLPRGNTSATKSYEHRSTTDKDGNQTVTESTTHKVNGKEVSEQEYARVRGAMEDSLYSLMKAAGRVK